MNILLNRLDNTNIANKSYDIIPSNIKKESGMQGMIVGANGNFMVNKKMLCC